MKHLFNKKDFILEYLIFEIKILERLKEVLTEYKKVNEELLKWLDSDEEYFYLNTHLKTNTLSLSI